MVLLGVAVYLTVAPNVSWFLGDVALAVWVGLLTIASYTFHDQLYQPTETPGYWAGYSDSVITIMVIVTLSTRVVANEKTAALTIGLPVAAATAKNQGAAVHKKTAVSATLLIGAGTCAVGAAYQDRDLPCIGTGAACLAVACASWYRGSEGWGGEGHAMWHVFSAATIAFLCLSCHIPQ